MVIKTSSRGFKYLDDLKTDYGHTVRVYESSAAFRPCLWMKVNGEGNSCGDVETELSVHMTLNQAQNLRDQLTLLIENHYQND